MNRTKSLLVVLVIFGLVISGCAAKSSVQTETADQEGSFTSPSLGVAEMAPITEQPALNSSKGVGVTGAAPDSSQMIMMTANLSVAVDDPSESMNAIQKLAREMGGYTVYSNLYKTQILDGSEVFEATITIRVPAQRLDEAMEKIKAMTGDPKKYVLNENISGQDVTKEYTDLQSRLRNLEEADAKLSELYASATKTEDALAIYNQKMQVTEQIELIKGQIKYYDESVSTSAISVQIQSKQSIAPLTVAGWKPSGVAKDALEALVKFGKGLVNVIIWLVLYVLPIVILFGLPVFFIVRGLVRRNRKNRGSNNPPAKGGFPPLPSEK